MLQSNLRDIESQCPRFVKLRPSTAPPESFSWLPYDAAYAGDVHNSRMNLIVKVLDFVQLGGARVYRTELVSQCSLAGSPLSV